MNKSFLKNVLIAAINLWLAFSAAYYGALWLNEDKLIMFALSILLAVVFGIFFFNAVSDVERQLRKKKN